MADDKLAGALLTKAAAGRCSSRDGPLPGAADWSHAEADAANTGASADQFLKAPLEMLWFDAPPRWFRTPGTTVVRVSGGRVLIKADTLQAIDVFTGRRLWEAAMPFSHTATDQMVALDDAIYVTGGKTCLVLDPASGRKKAQFDLPGDLSGPWLNLRAVGRPARRTERQVRRVPRPPRRPAVVEVGVLAAQSEHRRGRRQGLLRRVARQAARQAGR